jgi:hypothetical protein
MELSFIVSDERDAYFEIGIINGNHLEKISNNLNVI